MSGVSSAEIFWWVAVPYFALGVFVIGHVWRWRYDRYGWTSYSTQLQERRLLKWGGPIFHYATFAAIGGHVLGVLIPAAATNALGIPEHVYHKFAAIAGTVAAILVILGVVILAGRRLLIPRVRAATSPVDWVALVLLLLIIVSGIIPTIWNMFGSAYDYRHTVSPWFRGLFTGRPNVAAVTTAPLIYKVHAIAAWVIWMVWPFTRLVHAWSYPLWYLWRPFVVYRSRGRRRVNEPGTSGRRWRRIGAPF